MPGTGWAEEVWVKYSPERSEMKQIYNGVHERRRWQRRCKKCHLYRKEVVLHKVKQIKPEPWSGAQCMSSNAVALMDEANLNLA